MKKLLFFLIAMVFSSITWGQSLANYTYSTNTSGSLDPMIGATSFAGSGAIVSGYNDDNASGLANIGFNFDFMGTLYTQFSVNSNGQMRLGSTIVASNASIAASAPLIAPMAGDNSAGLAGDLDPISYVVTGTAPNRILKIQWKNFNIQYSSTATGGNMQVWLYETTGNIDMIYGAMTCNTAVSRSTYIASSNTATTAGFITLSATPTFTLTATAITNSFSVGNIANLYSATNGSRRVFTFTPSIIPTAPTWAVTPFTPVTQTGMTLNWVDNASNEFGYGIFRSDDAGLTYNFIAATAATATTYAATGLIPGNTYYWKVAAYAEGQFSFSSANSQATNPPGNIFSKATGGKWSDTATWVGGILPTATDNVTIVDGAIDTINTTSAVCLNLTVGQGTSGELKYLAGTASTLTVNGSVTIASGGNFNAGSGTLFTHNLYIGGSTAAGSGSVGSLTNNGTFDMNGTAGATVTFYGIPNASISGIGFTPDFYAIILNKGTSKASILDVTIPITMSSPIASGSRLTLTAGTFKMSSASTLTPWFGNQTICTANARLWLNNASASMTVVSPGTTASAGNPTVNGELLIDNGTFTYGSGSSVFTTSSTSVLTINGGTLNMYGAINLNSATTTIFTMTGGDINVDPQIGTTYGTATIFTIGTSTTVNWSGGNITIVDPNNATAGTAWSATSGGTKNITGGTLKIGDGISTSTGGSTANTNGFGLSGTMPVWNLEINTGSVASRQARVTGTTYVLNNLTIQANGYLFLGSATTGNSMIVANNVINSGTLAGCESGGTQHIGTLYMNGSTGTQNIAGTGVFTNLSSLTISNTGSGVNISNALVFDRVNLFTGLLDPTNLTLGSATVNPTVQIGSSASAAPGSFTVLPNYNYTAGYVNYLYAPANVGLTTGSYNEMPVGDPLTINQLYNSNTNGLTIDRSFQINSTLTMVVGNIFIGTNNLTLGVSAASAGTLTYTAGSLITSGGTFTRWFPTTGLPTSVGGFSIGYYPMAVSLGGVATNRNIQLAFSSATALSTGGTITCAVANAAGLTTGLSIADTVPSYIINRRTNSSWTLTPTGIVASGTIIMRAHGTGALVTTNYANLRLVKATSVVGKYLAGTGSNASPQVNRSLLTVADITGSFYIGAGDTNISNVIYSAQTGDWNAPASWVGGVVPTSTDAVVILNTHTITVTDAQSASLVTINSGGVLTASGGTLAIGNTLTNNGTFNSIGGTLTINGAATTGISNAALAQFNVNGGTVTLGPAGGGNRTFSNYGSLTVASGTLNINGNFYNSLSTGNVFTQTGGNINVDGNAAGVIANSVATGSYLVQLTTGTPSTLVLTGGTFTIVDPPAFYSTTYYALYGASTATDCGLGHTFRFGDGISTDRAGYGFYVYPYNLKLGNVVVNGSTGMDRFVQMYSTNTILGNITVNNGGDFRTYAGTNYLAGNITNNGIFTNANTLTLASYAGGVYAPSATAQTISGAGSFRNLLPTATVTAGGTGYVLGDILTLEGGTYTSQAKFLVTAVTSGAVSTVIALGYANYSVLPTTPASTTGGTGSGCTLTISTNLTPTASLASLTVNNTNVSGVTIGTPLSLSGTLTLTAGIVNTTTSNVLTLGTATAAGTLSGGSATAYISGPFARTFAARTAAATYNATTLYPVGKSGSYLPIWMDPTVVTNPVVMSGEAFASNSGTGGAGVTFLSPKRWEALVTSGLANFTGSYVQLGDTSIVTGNQIIQSASAAGIYGAIIPASIVTTGTPNTVTTNLTQILAANYNGYFAYGNLTPCTAPLQPTAFATSYNTSTGFIATFAAPSPAPSNYLVVRYPVDSLNISTPVNYTTYTAGNNFDTHGGKIVSISGATTFTESTLTVNTTYTYYIYAYNNTGCYGPVYNTTLPLTANVTTCVTAITAPTLTSSAISNVGFVVKWTNSGVDCSYILDIATDASFTSFVSGYNGLITSDTSAAISYLAANTPYYVRVRAHNTITSCYSNYSTTLTVLTLCDAYTTIPWSEGFESLGTSVGSKLLPTCWSYQNVVGTGGPTSSGTTGTYYEPRTGTNFLYTTYNNTTWIFTPRMRLTAGTSYTFSFYMMNKKVTNPVGFLMDVAYGTTNTNDSMTNVLATGIVCDNSAYTRFSYTVVPASNGEYYFGAKTISSVTTPWYISFDDFNLDFTKAPTVTTTTATLITGSTATAGGVVTDNGGAVVTARGVCWSTNAAPTLLDSYSTDGSGNGSYVSSLSSMAPSTLYHYRAYATNVIGTSYGGDSTFTTLNVFAPDVSMDEVITITDITATAKGTVSSDGGSGPILKNGFVRSTTVANPLIGLSGVVVDTVVTPSLGAYSVGLTGLTSGTLYYINAFAINSVGTSYGYTISFTTVGLTTTAASVITPYTAVSGGNITSDGGNAITARGVCYGTSANPTIIGSHTTDGTGMGSFVSNLTLPTASMLYHIRAYATNALGTFYGNDLSFRTLCDGGSILSTTPATRCGTGKDTLKATSSVGSTIEWFADSLGGTSIGSGSTFVTPVIGATTKYYAESQAPTTALNYTIGSGATTSATYSNPFYSLYSNIHTQHLIRATELQATGLRAGDITSVALNITSAGTLPMINLSVKIGTTTDTSMANFVSVSNTVYTNASLMPTLGLNVLDFTPPFYWDGVSNIVLEFCHGNPASTATMSRTAKADATSYVSSIKTHITTSPGTSAATICGDITTNKLTYSVRPTFTFAGVGVGITICSGLRIPVVATVTTPPALTLTGNDTVCNTVPDVTGNGVIVTKQVTSTLGDYATYVWTPIDSLYTDAAATVPYTVGANYSTVYFKSTKAGTTTYTCSASNDGAYSCATTATTSVTVRPAPVVSLGVSLNPICAGNSTTLTALTTAAVYTAPPTPSTPLVDEDLGNVTFGSLNNTTAVNSLVGTIGTATGTEGGYSDFTAFGPYNYTAGNTYPLKLTSITANLTNTYNNAFRVYIDYNHNGVFTDADESVFVSPALVVGPHTDSANITIPATALNGLTRMRVMVRETSIPASPTESFSWGEYEEYTLNITGGYNLASYQWTDGSLDLGTASSITVSPTESTTYFLNITEGNGCVKVIPTTIFISEAVIITSQPIAVTKCAGETATFTVAATGVGLSYQWKKNGSDIIGNSSASTASLVLPALSVADTANYSVVVTGICGTPATSNAVKLTVNPRPHVTPTTNTPVCSRTPLNFTGGTDIGSTFKWTGPNAYSSTSQNSSITSATLAAAGTYQFIATENGCSDTATTIVVVNETPSVITITPSSPTIDYGTVQTLNANGGTFSYVSANVGATSNSIGAGGTAALTYYLIFDVPATYVHINGVYVYPGAAGDVKFQISNSSGTVLQSFVYPVLASDIGVKTYIPVNFDVPNGTAYRMGYSSTVGGVSMYRNTAGAVYPYTIANVVSITGNSFSGYPQYYYYFYDWSVSVGNPETSTIAWTPTDSLFSDAAATIPYAGESLTTVYAKPSTTTTYAVTATSSLGCSTNGSTQVTVTCPTPILIPASNVIGATNAKIYWSSSSHNFEIECVPATASFTGVANYTLLSDYNAPHFLTLTSLAAGTNYKYKVRGECGAYYGSWSAEGTFTTLAPQGTWTGLSASTNDWNDATNWSGNVLPLSTDNVVIPASAPRWPHVNITPAECNDLTITAGGYLFIDAGKHLTVSGTFTNNAGADHFVIKSTYAGTGSLLHLNTGVSATVERSIHNEAADEFHMLGSPVAAQAISPNFNEADGFFVWNEAISEWAPYADEANFGAVNGGLNFVPGTAYAVSYPSLVYPGDTVKTFVGELNEGILPVTLSSTSGSTFEGWNFVSNPYPSSIDWDNLGFTRTALEDIGDQNYSMWIWDPNNASGSYGSYISNTGDYTNGLSSSIIPLAQGFWVKVFNPGGEFIFDDAVRTHSAQGYYKSTTASTDRIRLKVSSTANSYSDEILVKFGNASDLSGAEKMNSMYATAPNLYSTKLNKKWSINYLNTIAQHSVVPVSFKAGVNGNYTIHASELNSFATTTYVYLKDLSINTITDLNQNADYNFAATTNDNANRFELIFALSPLGVSDNVIENTSIYSNNYSIYINSNETIKQIAIYNTLGQLIKTVENINGKTIVNMKENATGYYLVRVVTNKNVYSEKVLIK